MNINESFAYGYLKGVVQGVVKNWEISEELKTLLINALETANKFENP